jgi:hypothetical protein
MDSLILQVQTKHLRYGNFEFTANFANFNPDEQGLFISQ